MQHQKIIEQLGYSRKEAKIYLASLSLGEAHISDIADKVNMPRSTVQMVVDRLCQDGLMNFYVMRRYKFWSAERPEKLLENLKKREELIQNALPELVAIRQASRNCSVKEDPLYIKSLSFLKTFSEALHQSVLVTNNDAEIVYVNSLWEKEMGHTLSEVEGENPVIFCSSETPESEFVSLSKSLKFDFLFQSDKIIVVRKDGTKFSIMTSIFPVHHGNRVFYIQMFTNTSTKESVKDFPGSLVDLLKN